MPPLPVSGVVETLMVPGPLKASTLPASEAPPVTLSVAPAAAPTPPWVFMLRKPEIVLVPLALTSVPIPKPDHMPASCEPAVVLSTTWLGRFTPPASSIAAPCWLVIAAILVTSPRAAELVIRTTP